MDNIKLDEEKSLYYMKVLPFSKQVTRVKNGKSSLAIVNNLTNEEIKNMSCEPRMLWRNNDDVYVAELPLTFRGTGVKWALYYVFDELSFEEQIKYEDRAIIIPVTINSVVSVYGNLTKNKHESKIKKRTKEKNEKR